MTPSSTKLGTRLVAGATILAATVFVPASVATRAEGAARVRAFTKAGGTGFAGDGGPAAAASLASPAGVASDATGDVAIADTDNCRVRYVPNRNVRAFGIAMRRGDIYTIAGSTCGSSGDGGPGTEARLSFPDDVAFDTEGDVLVADTGNNEIRKVSATTGSISLVAGTGVAGAGGDGRPATAAQLDGPEGIAVDAADDLYVADTNNCEVREVPGRVGVSAGALVSGHIRTIAGDGTCGDTGDGHDATRAELRAPADVAVDDHGDALIADTGNRLVREVAVVAGTNFGVAMSPGDIYTVVGSGTYNPYFGDGLPAVSDASSLSFPNGVALDTTGNLYVTDTYGRGVRVVPATGGTTFGMPTQADGVYTLAGAGPAESPTAGGTARDPLVYPARVAVDASGEVFVADVGNNSVELLEPPPG